MALGQIIRKRREELGMTLDEVAQRIGFSKPYLSTVETGKVRNPPSDACLQKLELALNFHSGQLQRIAHLERMPADIKEDFEAADAENRQWHQIFDQLVQGKVTPEQVKEKLAGSGVHLGRPVPEIAAGRMVPVINCASAGQLVDFDDMGYPVGFAEEYVRCPDLHDPNAFAVRVMGDSMEPKFREGDIVIFSPAADYKSGDDCFVRLTLPHESTFKRVYFEPNDQVRLQPRNQGYPPITVEGNRINGIYRAILRYERL